MEDGAIRDRSDRSAVEEDREPRAAFASRRRGAQNPQCETLRRDRRITGDA